MTAKFKFVSPAERDKQFLKERQKAQEAEAEKIARLRALRLARDAAAAPAVAEPAAKKRTRRASPAAADKT